MSADTRKPDGDLSVTGSAAELEAVLIEVAAAVDGSDDPGALHQRLIDAAVATIPGVDRASLMVVEPSGLFRTSAASDPVAATVDAIEQHTGEGPCLDAVLDQRPQLVTDLATGEVWPELSARVLAATPVRGSAGFRIVVDEVKSGALNLFADRAGALTEESIRAGVLFAALASASIIGTNFRREAGTLRAGLVSNREIGKAIGLLMARYELSDAQAFAALRETSQQLNVKISALARTVLADHHREGQ